MSDNISILRAGQPVGLKVFDFPGGEIGVKVDGGHWSLAGYVAPAYQTIVARMQGPRDILALMFVADALRQLDNTPIRLVMPYVPYARQDRVCVTGESFSLKVFAGLINGLAFEQVTVLDPHSDVTGALIDRLTVISQVDIINKWPELTARLRQPNVQLISPDAGANKKTGALASYLGHADYLRADKKRDLATGKIIETIVYAADLAGQTVAIIDDCCDGGATFINLAKALKAKGAAKVVLYVTHGIFSKGIIALLHDGIDEVWTVNSYSNPAVDVDSFIIANAFPNEVKVLDINILI